jgi:hypothetical protein
MDEPVAFVKLIVTMVAVLAVKPPLKSRFEPVAPLKETVFKAERPETARDADESVPAANTEPFV